MFLWRLVLELPLNCPGSGWATCERAAGDRETDCGHLNQLNRKSLYKLLSCRPQSCLSSVACKVQFFNWVVTAQSKFMMHNSGMRKPGSSRWHSLSVQHQIANRKLGCVSFFHLCSLLQFMAAAQAGFSHSCHTPCSSSLQLSTEAPEQSAFTAKGGHARTN